MPSSQLAATASGEETRNDATALAGHRVLVLHPDADIAARKARALQKRGAMAIGLSNADLEIRRAEALDPDVVIMDPANRTGLLAKLVKEIESDWRLRWSTSLQDEPSRWGGDGSDASWATTAIRALCSWHTSLAHQLSQGASVSMRLEEMGGGALLRVAAASGMSLRVHVEHPHATVDIDLADRMIMGAAGQCGEGDGRTILGGQAISMLLSLPAGRVEITPTEHVELDDLRAAPDLILASATPELAWLAPLGLLPLLSSLPPPPGQPWQAGYGGLLSRGAPAPPSWVSRIALGTMFGIATGMVVLHVWVQTQ